MEPLIIIYRVTNIENGRAYIGQTKNGLMARKSVHMCDSRRKLSKNAFHRALNKHGPAAFKWEILEECKDLGHLNERERFYIKLLNTMSPAGYNLTEGGNANQGATDETREKLRELNLGDKNPMFGEIPWNKGQETSEETKLRQSQARLALAQMPGYVHPTLGKKRTPEQIAKSAKGPRMRGQAWQEAHKGQYSDEVRAVMSAKAKARKPNISKPVICLDTGVTYASAREASRQLNIAFQKISQCCLGHRKTHGGLKWAFADKKV